VAKVAQTAIEFPPMQPGASFNLEAVKAQIEKARAAHGQQFLSEVVFTPRCSPSW
jgi:arylsulfatase